MISSVLILGGGSAGLTAAITLKRALPHLDVRVVRSTELGVIGVGEGTTAYFKTHFFKNLALNPKKFYEEAQPTWKLGIRFLWGKNSDFYYSFSNEFDKRLEGLSRNPGFYTDHETRFHGVTTACMHHDRAFPRRADGAPDLSASHAFHVENEKLVKWLENTSRALGVKFTDDKVENVEMDGPAVGSLHLEGGERLKADLYIDASGFRSELLSKALGEAWVNYSDTLFCDRAVIGGWERTGEPIHPYTIAETMDAGWCWQIEHETWINRGYVYSSRFISDEDALNEFRRKNPKVPEQPRVVKFRSGRTQRSWVGNVVGIGNASGFVEPLEATALHHICVQCRRVGAILMDSFCDPSPMMVDLYNEANSQSWDEIRDFLAVHYAFNDKLDTPFWKECRDQTPLRKAEEIVRFYRENGPTSFSSGYLMASNNSFGLSGYLAMLVGQRLPHSKPYQPSPKELQVWKKHLSAAEKRAKNGLTVGEALKIVRSPGWKWSQV